MTELIIAFIATMLASYALVALIRPALTRHVLAHQNERSSHTGSVPQGAGIGVTMAVIVALSAAKGAHLLPLSVMQTAALAACLALLSGVGLMDDRAPLPILPRLGAQALAAVMAVLILWPHGSIGLQLVAVLATFAIINAVNFLDGIDGITITHSGGVALASAVVLLASGPQTAATLPILLAGALAGFWAWNKPPARLFLGDAGSLPIGLLTALVLVEVMDRAGPVVALILALFLLMETGTTLAARLLAGQKFWQSHRSHAYQRAVQRGLSVPTVLGAVALCETALAALALLALSASLPLQILLMLCGACLTLVLLWHFRGGLRL